MEPSYRVRTDAALEKRLGKINQSLAWSAHKDKPSVGGKIWSKLAGKTISLLEIQQTITDNAELLNRPTRKVYAQMEHLRAKIESTYADTNERRDLLKSINAIMGGSIAPSPTSAVKTEKSLLYSKLYVEEEEELGSVETQDRKTITKILNKIEKKVPKGTYPPFLKDEQGRIMDPEGEFTKFKNFLMEGFKLYQNEEHAFLSLTEQTADVYVQAAKDLHALKLQASTRSFPNETGALPRLPADLKFLDIKKWQGTDFPESIYHLDQLKLLMFAFNERSPLELNLMPGQLPELRSLSLTRCLIDKIPPELAQLPSLTSVYLVDCGLPDVDLTHLAHIKHLSFFGTPIETLPKSITALTNLTELICTGCNLIDLPNEIGSLSNLEKLDITQNTTLIGFPPTLGNLTKLKEIRCDRAHIPLLPNSLVNCDQLERIVLTDGTLAWYKKSGLSLEEFLKKANTDWAGKWQE